MAVVDVSVDDTVDWPEEAVRADAERVLAALDLDAAELSVLLTDDEGIQPLNRDWRGKDKPTDVLSFSQYDPDEAPPPGVPLLLGDVVISVQTATRQAAERGHDTAHEVRILLVHGICHLIGHDHEEDDEAEEMEALERRLLDLLGSQR